MKIKKENVEWTYDDDVVICPSYWSGSNHLLTCRTAKEFTPIARLETESGQPFPTRDRRRSTSALGFF
jgi:hypothetical protein